jgi:hypothetical protein
MTKRLFENKKRLSDKDIDELDDEMVKNISLPTNIYNSHRIQVEYLKRILDNKCNCNENGEPK